MKISTRPKDGHLPKRTRDRIKDTLLALDGKAIEISIKRKRKTRSTPQNAYYWGVIIPLTIEAILSEWGEYIDTNQAHEMLKAQCNYKERVNESTGEIIKQTQSTANLTTVEFEVYAEKCRRFLAEWFGVTPPLPNEQITI